MDPIRLEIPPRSAYVGVVRLVAGSVARAAGLDEERVNDVKIAVSEVCASAVLAAGDGTGDPLAIELRSDGSDFVVEVGGAGAASGGDVAGEDHSRERMAADLLETLARVSRSDGDGGSSTVLAFPIEVPQD